MLKKHFRDIYLIAISFIAGVLFIIQCGGQVVSIAEDIASAIGIEYSNTGSGLSATTVQDALDELANRFPVVFDSNENPIGIFLDKYTTYTNGWSVWIFEHQVVVSLDPLTAEVVQDSEPSVHFSGDDCTGTPYLLFQEDGGASEVAIRQIGGTYYHPDFRGNTIRGTSIVAFTELKSTLTEDTSAGTTSCSAFTGRGSLTGGSSSSSSLVSVKAITADEIGTTYVEARIVELSSFSAPLYLGKSIE